MNDHIQHQALKASTAVGLSFAGLTVSEWAAVAGLFYSVLLIGEWFWKKILRPMALVRGWIQPKHILLEEE